MDLAKLWTQSSWARRVMFAVIALLFVSQFFEYYDETGSMIVGSDGLNISDTMRDGQPGTGWELHPHAIVVLLLLLGFFGSNLQEDKSFGRLGWIVCIALVGWCIWPFTIRTLGGQIGLWCVGLTIVAAVLNWFSSGPEPKKDPPGPA